GWEKMRKHGIHIKKGDIIRGKYKILQHIATGGMSEVYLAGEIHQPEQVWAVKIAHMDDKLSRTLVDEAKILSELDHPNLPQIVDFFSSDTYYYLVMEYADGDVLSDYLNRENNELPLELILQLAIQLCDCFAYLHN